MAGRSYLYPPRAFSGDRLKTLGRGAVAALLGLGAALWGWWGEFWLLPTGFALLALSFYALLWRFSNVLGARFGPLHVAFDLGLLALLIRATGGSLSPFSNLAYLWFFGVLLLYVHRWPGRTLWVVAFLPLLALAAGSWGSPDWLPGLGTHALGLVAAGWMGSRISRERLENRCDPLTRVLHRRAGMEGLRARVASGAPLTLVFLDLRGFKAVNDRYGHAVGDEVLCTVAARLSGELRQGDLVMRYGGDEFVAVGGATVLRERLERAFAAPLQTSVGMVTIGVDIGEAVWHPGDSVETLLARADATMYHTKARAYAQTGAIDHSSAPKERRLQVARAVKGDA